MSTFVVRLLGRALDSFHGRVRHVASGEETSFSSPTELVAFMEGVNGVSGLGAEVAGGADRAPPPVARYPAPAATHENRKGRGRKRGVAGDVASPQSRQRWSSRGRGRYASGMGGTVSLACRIGIVMRRAHLEG